MSAAYYDHRCHQILPIMRSSSPREGDATDFISEDDLKTFKNSFHVVGHDARGAIVLRQKVVAWPSGSAARQYTALPDRRGSLRRRTSPEPQTRIPWSRCQVDAGPFARSAGWLSLSRGRLQSILRERQKEYRGRLVGLPKPAFRASIGVCKKRQPAKHVR
jgi:hypothetical protein